MDGNGVRLNGRQARDGDLVCEDDYITTDDTSFADIELQGGGYVHIDRGTDPRFARQRSGDRCVVVYAFNYGQIQMGARAASACFLVRTPDVTFSQRGGLVNVSVPRVAAPAPARAPAPSPPPPPPPPPATGAATKPLPPLTFPRNARSLSSSVTLASIKPLGTTVTVIHGPPVRTLPLSVTVTGLKTLSSAQIASSVQGSIAPKEAVVYKGGTKLQAVPVIVQRNQLPPDLDWSRRSGKLAPRVLLPTN